MVSGLRSQKHCTCLHRAALAANGRVLFVTSERVTMNVSAGKIQFMIISLGVLAACSGGSEDKVRHFGAGAVAAYVGEEATGSQV